MLSAIHGCEALGLFVAGASSLFWTLAYALIVLRGARDKSTGMPFTALGANLAWEIVFLGVTVANGATDVRLALLVPWTALDLVIVGQAFAYGRREVSDPWLARRFPIALSALLIFAGAALFAFVREIGDAIGWITAFGQNLMMSALFVSMLLRRRSPRGQSPWIAASKLLGTLFAFLLALFWSPRTLHEHWPALLPESYSPIAPLLVVLYSGVFVLDVLYLVLLVRTLRERGCRPWEWHPSFAGDSGKVPAPHPAAGPGTP